MCGVDTAKCCKSEEVYANREIYIEIKTGYKFSNGRRSALF
jgi:hypothetical protein